MEKLIKTNYVEKDKSNFSQIRDLFWNKINAIILAAWLSTFLSSNAYSHDQEKNYQAIMCNRVLLWEDIGEFYELFDCEQFIEEDYELTMKALLSLKPFLGD